MTYSQFNKAILEFYLSRTSSFFFTLSIDPLEFKNVIELESIKEFTCLREQWVQFLDLQNSIPQYFGLLAVQCLAASLMENDYRSSAEAYQIRLRELLNLYDDACLQNLFKGMDSANRIQEQIWYQAKAYLKEEHNLILQIPSKTFYKGRYVQYPRSQALLNSEDLKHFTSFFYQEFEVNEDIPLQHFRSRLEACFYNLNTSNHTLKLWEDHNKREQCVMQLFNYYNLWGGEVHFLHATRRNAKGSPETLHKGTVGKVKASLLLSFENGQPKFYVIKYNELNKEEAIAISAVQAENYKPANNEFLIFNKSDYYENEFDSSRFLFSDSCSYILVNKRVISQSIYRFFDRNSSKAIVLTDTLILFNFTLLEELPNVLRKYMQARKPVRLIGGLKINRRSEYLQGYGPSILSEVATKILFENRKVEYDSQVAKPGSYTVRAEYCKDVSFAIIEDVAGCCNVLRNEHGWNLRTFSIDTEYHLQGLNLEDKTQFVDMARAWISINAKRCKIENTNSSSILIKTLNNHFGNDRDS